jgi:hypothetical protein
LGRYFPLDREIEILDKLSNDFAKRLINQRRALTGAPLFRLRVMPSRPNVFRPSFLGDKPLSKRDALRKIDERRQSSAKRGYGYRWQKARAAYLAVNPICATKACGQLATIVDHIRRHNGDQALFWDQANWQPLCFECHARKSPSDVFTRLME